MASDLDRLLERGESLCGEHRKVWPECASLHPEVSGDLPDLPGFAEHFGVRLSFIGDDGDWIVALGHHEPRRVIAALNRHVRDDLGWSSLSDEWENPTYADVLRLLRQTWCVLAKGCSDHRDAPEDGCVFCRDVKQAEWWLDWHGITKDTQGAFPIMVVER